MIGSISAAEFAVVVAGSVGFLVGLGLTGVNLGWVAVLLAGGVVAAPVAAWLARHIPPRMLGSLVGGLIVVTNLRTLFHAGTVSVSATGQLVALTGVGIVWAAAIGWSARAHRAAKIDLPTVAGHVRRTARRGVAGATGNHPG